MPLQLDRSEFHWTKRLKNPDCDNCSSWTEVDEYDSAKITLFLRFQTSKEV